tara:strand:+ start:578 stop:1117 length:540 start_codon:yes stop_codon:yes gene_type:complete
MITFSPADSPFYDANKTYCDKIISEFENMNVEPHGFCNAYGYDIFAKIETNKFVYDFNYHKHHSTQEGVILPKNSLLYSDIKLKVFNLSEKKNFLISNSFLTKLFYFRRKTFQLKNNQFAKSNIEIADSDIQKIKDFSEKYKIMKFHIYNGTLKCKLVSELNSPKELITELNKILSPWE